MGRKLDWQHSEMHSGADSTKYTDIVHIVYIPRRKNAPMFVTHIHDMSSSGLLLNTYI